MATRLLFAVLATVILPLFWREVRKWEQSGEAGTSWPPTPGRVRLVKVGLIAFIALEWVGVAVGAFE